MSHYSDYLKEIMAVETTEFKEGFFTYSLEGPSIYLIDIYIIPEARGGNTADDIIEIVTGIGKENGCETILSSISRQVEKETQERSTHILKKNNFKPIKVDDYMIYFAKEIE